MIQGQHKNILSIYYEDSIIKALDYLRTKYSIIDCDRNADDVPQNIRLNHQYSKFYKVEISCLLKAFTLILAFPESFPDNFPKIYLSEKDYNEIYPIPHIDKNRLICTRDPEVIVLNDGKPGEAVEELIEIAVEILNKGIKGENKEDFVKEFIAYWNDESRNIFLSLFEPIEDCKKLFLFKLSKKLFGHSYILSESEERIIKWLIPFKLRIENEKHKVLYIPLSEFSPFLLNVNSDLLKILGNQPNKKYIREVGDFLNEKKNNHIIISSFQIDGERILFGWMHQRGKVEQFRGFRRNHVPLDIRLTDPKNKSTHIDKIEIIRLDKDRIFKRGGTITTFLKKDISIMLVGCGSLGSYLAMSLSRCGISKFTLIDNDDLRPENTPRHLCGFSEASRGMKKVDAVKNRLIEHFPHLEIETYNSDFLQLLQEQKNILKGCDLLILAVGNKALERRINFIQRKEEIDCPIVYLWIEPFGVGGHILYIYPGKDGCYWCCFDNNGNFLYTIVGLEEEFLKRESGCQSTFLPYSSLHIEQFISIACKKILAILDGRLKESMLYTWVGDIKEFEDLGFRINSNYDARFPYEVIERKVLPNESCSICGKKE